MKSLLLFILIGFAMSRAEAQSIRIGTDTFHPVYTNSSSEGFLREYCLRAETTNNWTKLFAVRHFRKVASPKDYIARMGEEYHKQLPWMTYASGGDPANGRWYIDFLRYERNGPKTMEWNFFRAETNATGGILVYQYAERRKYKKSLKELDSWDVKSLRKQMVPVLMTNEFSLR